MHYALTGMSLSLPRYYPYVGAPRGMHFDLATKKWTQLPSEGMAPPRGTPRFRYATYLACTVDERLARLGAVTEYVIDNIRDRNRSVVRLVRGELAPLALRGPSLEIEGGGEEMADGENSTLAFYGFPSLEMEGSGVGEAIIFDISASTPTRFDSTSSAVHRKNLMP